MIFQAVIVTVFLCYALLIVIITIGWWRLKEFKKSDGSPNIKVSVIVAARNEAGNIKNLINSLCQQDYPSDLYEVFIVDDHSTDSTAQLAHAILQKQNNLCNIKLITLSASDGKGKKAALKLGIQESSGELIVITDADCMAGSSWISTIASFYEMHKPQMILGPVQMTDEGSVFGRLQSLEFISLISSAAGSCSAGFPLLANGANIAFTREAYTTCNGFEGNMQYASGDDMFLMMSIKNKFGASSIRFLKAVGAIVHTPSTPGFKSFIRQRMRWVSKSRGYTDPFLIAASVIVFLTNAGLVISAFSALVFAETLNYFLGIYLFKLVVDLPLIISYSRFQGSAGLLWLFPPMELLNAAYTLLIGIAGNFGRYTWKGRQI